MTAIRGFTAGPTTGGSVAGGPVQLASAAPALSALTGRLLGLAACLALSSACAGRGVSWTEVQKPVQDTCVACHDPAKIRQRIADVKALEDKHFTAQNFPDSVYAPGLIKKTVADLINTADPPDDATIDPATPERKAWLLHELNEQKALLEEAVPADFTSEEKFNAFATLRKEQNYEGCEIGDRLDRGFAKDPEGMPPQWAEKLFELLKQAFTPLSPADRQKIKDYVNGLVPGGLKACVPGQGSAS